MHRNVFFVDGFGNDIGGIFQNGSVIWKEIQQYLRFLYNYYKSYAVYPCMEPVDLKNLVDKHGPALEMDEQKVLPGYYVILSPQGTSTYALYLLHPN